MFKKVINILKGFIPKEMRPAFELDMFRAMYGPTVIVAVLILLLEAGIMASSFIFSSSFGIPERLQTYRILYSVLFLMTLACMSYILIFKKQLEKKPKIFLNVVYLYGYAITFWAGTLNAYERIFSGDLTVMVYIFLFVAILVVMEPWKALILYTLNFIWFWIWLHIFKIEFILMFGNLINAMVVTVLSITIASVLYAYRAKNFLARNTIIKQKQEIQIMNDELNNLVVIDELTKLKNRRYYDESLPQIFENAKNDGNSFVVSMLDIDFFKQYNDTYGHQAGDTCLQTITKLVKEVLRAKDYSFIRYGGEEFLLVQVGLSEKTALEVAHRICDHIAAQKIPHEQSPQGYITVSIGLRVSPPEEIITLKKLVAQADEALYIAKNKGRNQVVLYDTNIEKTSTPNK